MPRRKKKTVEELEGVRVRLLIEDRARLGGRKGEVRAVSEDRATRWAASGWVEIVDKGYGKPKPKPEPEVLDDQGEGGQGGEEVDPSEDDTREGPAIQDGDTVETTKE